MAWFVKKINQIKVVMKLNIKPLADRVLLEPMEAETKTASGIIIPDNAKDNPQQYRLPSISEKLNLINTQITRVFSESFQLYLGVENLTNYKQENAIISSDDPFGDYFDATYVYGPIFGRMTYVGLRYYIK